jgi:hypothetical protein
MKVIYVISLIAMVFCFWSCEDINGGFNGGKPQPTIKPPEIADEAYLAELDRHMTNYLLNGREIFDEVVESYEGIRELYDNSAEIFDTALNASLTLDTGEGEEADINNAFNYTAFTYFEGSTIYIRDSDGTYVSLPGLPVEKTGYKSGENPYKKLMGHLYYVKDDILAKIPDLKDIQEHVEAFFRSAETVTDQLEGLEKFVDGVLESGFVTSAFDIISSVSEFLDTAIPVVGFIFDVINFFSPSQEQVMIDVMQKNFEKVFHLLEGIYTHLEWIENKLIEIEQRIAHLGCQMINIHFGECKSRIRNTLSLINNAANTYEMRRTYAITLNGDIDSLIQNYIGYSLDAYQCYRDNYLRANNDPEVRDVTIAIHLPITEHYVRFRRPDSYPGALASRNTVSCGSGGCSIPWTSKDVNFSTYTEEAQKTYTINLTYHNPSIHMPISYEMINNLHQIILARFQINNLIYLNRNDLDTFNAERASWILERNGAMIPHIKEAINQAFLSALADYNTVLSEIEAKREEFEHYLSLPGNWQFNGMSYVRETTWSSSPCGGTNYYYRYIPLSSYHFTDESNDFYIYRPAAELREISYGKSTCGGSSVFLSDLQQSLASNNPFKYIIIRGGENSGRYPYYDCSYNSYTGLSHNIPSSIITRVTHDFNNAEIFINDENAATTKDTIDTAGFFDNIKSIVRENYRAYTQNLIQMAIALASLEIDLKCYIHDPETAF